MAPESAIPAHHPDTVADAAATPEREMPWKELGLKADEYESIRELLGRRPTNAELAMYSVMWSEHCSYKSSKIHLRQFADKTTPAMHEHLLVGMGQNAGVVDIGGGWAVTFKVESHNHPSYVEPYQGAATGVGGIVRDIISMGARPVWEALGGSEQLAVLVDEGLAVPGQVRGGFALPGGGVDIGGQAPGRRRSGQQLAVLGPPHGDGRAGDVDQDRRPG